MLADWTSVRVRFWAISALPVSLLLPWVENATHRQSARAVGQPAGAALARGDAGISAAVLAGPVQTRVAVAGLFAAVKMAWRRYW